MKLAEKESNNVELQKMWKKENLFDQLYFFDYFLISTITATASGEVIGYPAMQVTLLLTPRALEGIKIF